MTVSSKVGSPRVCLYEEVHSLVIEIGPADNNFISVYRRKKKKDAHDNREKGFYFLCKVGGGNCLKKNLYNETFFLETTSEFQNKENFFS